jgi:ATP-dependent helicase/nuclease subunit A
MKGELKPLVDSAARERATTDLSTSFCVEAGAGTGKTSLLVGRFLGIVESGKAVCSRIVAITFTEKAAGEMKVRLRQEILKRLADTKCTGDARGNLEAAYDELERAPISTIHSFAATILREHPIEAGIDPNFAQLDALESELFLDECWNDFLMEGAGEWGETLRRFVMLGGSIENLRAIAEALYRRRADRSCERLFDRGETPRAGDGALRRRPEPSDCAAESARQESGTGLKETLLSAAAHLSALARQHCVNPADPGCRAIEKFGEEMKALDRLEGDDLVRFLLALRLPKGKGSKGNWRPAGACAEQKERFGQLAELQEIERKRISDRLRGCLEKFAVGFLAFVEKRKTAMGVLDFDDLLVKVRELCRNGSALNALRERYSYLLVDEFQDTDPIQAEIVYLLAGPPRGRSGSGNRCGSESVPGKLFIVGDPKQSIYRFRKADIEMYELVKARLAGEGELLSITQNFRSVPGIIKWVNETFSDVMQPPEGAAFQPRYEAIHPAREGEGSPVVLIDLELEGENSKAREIRTREGEMIARFIHRLLDSGATVVDAKAREARPVRFGDIAVIYPGTTGIDCYEEPLRAENIPYIVEGGKLYYARDEIRDLSSAVWAIEDPYDALALVGALRSPMFGASDEELFLFVRSGGRLNYLAPGPAAAKFGGIGAAFALLTELHRARNELGSSGTILELLRRTKFLELSLLRPHGEQRVSNLRKAISSARAFEGKINSYRRFARWFRDQEMLVSAESESPIVEEEENAVRLLTVHKAKGLQFPIVILANLVQSKRHSSNILIEDGRRLSFKLGYLETSGHAALAEAEKERETAETVRLLYVAATRAGDMLVIPRMPKAGSYFDLISARLDSEQVEQLALSSLPQLRGKPRPFVRFAELSEEEEKRVAEERARWMQSRARLLERAKAAPLVLVPSKLGSDALASERGAETIGEVSAFPRGSRDRNLLFGQAFHRIMELADLSDTRRLGALAVSVASELGIGNEASELGRLAATTLGSDLIIRAARSSHCYREVPFTLRREGNFIEGRIDLLFEEDGAWTLVDFKTDDTAAVDVDGRFAVYRAQAAVYAFALKGLGVECTGGIALFFVRPNVVKTIELSAAVVREAEELIRGEFLRQAGA